MLAKMQKALQNTQKGVASGEPNVTFDSEAKDRDLEKSDGGVEDGPGTTNQDIGPHVFDTKKKKQGEYTEDRTKAGYKVYTKASGKKPGKIRYFWKINGTILSIPNIRTSELLVRIRDTRRNCI